MAQKIRVEYPGATCHELNPGDRCEPIFRDDANRECFVETPQATLVAGMQWFSVWWLGR